MSDRWPALLSREEAADYLGCSVETLSKIKAGGRIHSVIVHGSLVRYRRVDLDAFIDRLPRGDGTCPANAARDRKFGVGHGPRKSKSKTAEPAA